MAQTKFGDIGSRTAAYAVAKLLEHARPLSVLPLFAQVQPVPKNKTDTVKFRRPVPFPALTTPVVEGVTPPSIAMQFQDVTVQLQQWGNPVEITDQVLDFSEDPVLSTAIELCGEQAAETIEAIIWGVLRGGTNVVYANGSARSDVNTAISLDDVRSAVATLQRNRARRITRVLDGSVKINTTPIEASFVCVSHTDCEPNIRALAGFTPTSQYGNRSVVHEAEFGATENVRFVTSPLLNPILGAGSGTLNGMRSEGGVNVDIYPYIVMGMDAFATVALRGANAVTPMVVNPKPSAADPMAQRGYVSWKTYHNAVRLNEAWMVRIEAGVTSI